MTREEYVLFRHEQDELIKRRKAAKVGTTDWDQRIARAKPAVDCPFCGADSGAPCLRPDGTPYGFMSAPLVHAARRALI